MEVDGECFLEYEEYCCCIDICGVGNRCVVLDLVDKIGLDGYDCCYDIDYREELWKDRMLVEI